MASSRSREIRVSALSARKPFQSGAMRGYWDAIGGGYVVFSYGVKIGETDRDGFILYYDSTKYSVTTSHHQSALREAWNLSGVAIDRRGVTA